MAEKSANFVALKALLGWDDASNSDAERLVTLGGLLGMVIDAGVIEFFSVDRWTGDTIRTRITGPWSFGTIRTMAQHLVMVHTLGSRDG